MFNEKFCTIRKESHKNSPNKEGFASRIYVVCKKKRKKKENIYSSCRDTTWYVTIIENYRRKTLYVSIYVCMFLADFRCQTNNKEKESERTIDSTFGMSSILTNMITTSISHSTLLFKLCYAHLVFLFLS